MADFRPETTIRIFKGTGVDRKNQPYFTSEGAKMGWYNSFPSRTFSNYSYQREARQYARVEAKADELRDYDMMAFQNSSNKWVLCNITGIEWVNPNTADIFFETDYMQTFVEDIVFDKCWVEREMQDNDWNGGIPSFNNLQPEGLGAGLSKRTLAMAWEPPEGYSLVVYSVYDRNGEPNYNTKVSHNYPSGLNEIVFNISGNTVVGFDAFLKAYADKGIILEQAIVGAYVVPSVYASSGYTNGNMSAISNPYPLIDGYKVINAKCFTSEFFNLEVSNRQGNTQLFKPEIMKNQFSFSYEGANCCGAGGFVVYPTAYEGNRKDYAVVLPCDTQAAFVGNSFATWLANHGVAFAISTANNLVGSLVGGNRRANAIDKMLPGPVGESLGTASMALNIVDSVVQSFDTISERISNPSVSGGSVNGSPLQIVIGNYGFTFNWVHPFAENIRSIDEYFSRFGYKTNRFKVPNVNTRPKWNYVKTIGAAVHGPMTGIANQDICNSLDSGVTFWHVSGGVNCGEFGSFEENQ